MDKQQGAATPMTIFYSYAHADESLRKDLEKHLSSLRREGLIAEWHDCDINAGMEWEREINAHLNAAQIILLLVSPDFIDSEYCYGIEMKRAMERHERGEAFVIPVILRHVYWQGAPFGKLQALPTGAKPVVDRSWHDLDEAFFDVVKGIRKVVREYYALRIRSSLADQRDRTSQPSLASENTLSDSGNGPTMEATHALEGVKEQEETGSERNKHVEVNSSKSIFHGVSSIPKQTLGELGSQIPGQRRDSKGRTVDLRRWSIIGVIALITISLLASFNGIVGNRSDNLFIFIIDELWKSITTGLWSWAIVFITLLACLAMVFYSWRHIRVLNRALGKMKNILELDDALLRFLPSWTHDEHQIKLFLAEALRDALELFQGEVCRASLLLPDPQEYLRVWTHYGMSQEDVNRIGFYIGSDASKQREAGVAGEAFLRRQLLVGHIKATEGTWVCDIGSYTRFPGSQFPPPYRSFIIVPIIAMAPKPTERNVITCLGIICLDSMKQTVFDDSECQTALTLFARRFAIALLIYRLRDSNHTSSGDI